MDKFNLYAKYYDLLYEDKDYKAEVDYVNRLIIDHTTITVGSLLDLGCGTGIHASLFEKFGYKVHGVDLSSKMIDQARNTFADVVNLEFFESDITTFEKKEKYDIVTSLFHVISYQNSNENIVKSFTTAYNHLKDDGLFIFDFWYGPGVLTDRPESRLKVLENDVIHVSRKATPQIHINKNIVDVKYDINIVNKTDDSKQQISELHSMRYFFIQELSFYLKHVGFEMLDFFEWMTLKKPDTNSWNVVVVAKKSRK